MIDLFKRGFFPLYAPDDGSGGGKEDPPTDTADTDGQDADKTPDADAQAAQDGDKPDAGADGANKGKDTALGEDTPEGDVATPADWPDDWREKLAGGDADMSKLLKRFGSPQAVAKAFKDSQELIRSGKVKREMPDPEDAEAMKEWRKAEGVPDDPTGYVIPETVKELVTDDDKPMLASFTEFAHGKNAPQQAVDLATEWYFQTQEQIATQQSEADKSAKEEAIESLRAEYGRDFKPNMELARAFMDITPEIGKDWMMARLPDGRMLGNVPEFVQWAVDQGRAQFGDTTFVNPDAEAQHNNRKAEIEKVMSEDIDRYYREGLDKEYNQILQREEKRTQR